MHISLVPPNPPPQPLSLAVMSAMLEIWYTTLTYLIYRGQRRKDYSEGYQICLKSAYD